MADLPLASCPPGAQGSRLSRGGGAGGQRQRTCRHASSISMSGGEKRGKRLRSGSVSSGRGSAMRPYLQAAQGGRQVQAHLVVPSLDKPTAGVLHLSLAYGSRVSRLQFPPGTHTGWQRSHSICCLLRRPKHFRMRYSWSWSLSPGNSGSRVTSSASRQPAGTPGGLASPLQHAKRALLRHCARWRHCCGHVWMQPNSGPSSMQPHPACNARVCNTPAAPGATGCPTHPRPRCPPRAQNTAPPPAAALASDTTEWPRTRCTAAHCCQPPLACCAWPAQTQSRCTVQGASTPDESVHAPRTGSWHVCSGAL